MVGLAVVGILVGEREVGVTTGASVEGATGACGGRARVGGGSGVAETLVDAVAPCALVHSVIAACFVLGVPVGIGQHAPRTAVRHG